jgi:Tfp pilus assembly protein PilF
MNIGQKQLQKTSNKCENHYHGQSRSRFSFLSMDFLLISVMVIFVFVVFSSSINGPFVFDDTFNIKDNPNIRLTNLTLDGIIGAGFRSPCRHRPVANMSFALNYYLNRYDTAGYHFINILIHILTGIILFYLIKTTLLLLSSQNLKFRFETNILPDKPNAATSPYSFNQVSHQRFYLSFFAALIWLVHPIQTQTVSYIVQRMNGMAAMFYILSLLFYIKARLSNAKGKKLALFFGCILSGILSLGSKEIAVTLPFFIFLYEWYFFQDVNLKWIKHNLIYLLCLLFIISFATLYFLDGHPIKGILSTYSHRDFTLWQRVLTEFRVIIYYISLILFPHPMRLNLLHDFPISHSFLNPITTLFSLVAIAGMLVPAIWLAKRERLISFCVLWFLGNLVVESSVIGAEIIFEHRLYLPSMFFILIFVSLIYRFDSSKWIGGILLCAVVIVFSVWTYQRNIVWSDDVNLWKDCVVKSPQRPRQHYNLGVVLARNGNLDDAIKHYRTAINIKPDYVEAYYNLGNALARKGDAKDAIYNYRKALQFNPDFFKSYYNIAKILYDQGKISEAIQNYQKALSINSRTPQILFNLSWIYATSGNRKYRNGKKAVNLSEKLCTLTAYQQPLALDALAAAYAENGNFTKAVDTAQKALGLAMQLGPKELILGLKDRLKLYKAGQPYRQNLK